MADALYSLATVNAFGDTFAPILAAVRFFASAIRFVSGYIDRGSRFGKNA
ncbi:hypothetical protein GCM10011571_19820 [Marinithermofilum abyssi]|uniref:Uncharacterized protein n=1 Tax=Marinithermofilum abyssi TaxID=1571185 RepID=A0A8J2YE55_9BACL|nr:hypothetical protein GCM10011571_19820 [Marinithermofilum abyssi]